jgi:Ca2+-dependent lipid-binding protein
MRFFTDVPPSYNPTWNETKFILVNCLTDHLVLTMMDYNEFRKDTELGASLFELSKLDVDATQDGQCLPILKDGKTKGELRCDVAYFPVLKPLVNESGVQELPESSKSRLLSGDFLKFINHACRRGHRTIYDPSGQGP